MAGHTREKRRRMWVLVIDIQTVRRRLEPSGRNMNPMPSLSAGQLKLKSFSIAPFSPSSSESFPPPPASTWPSQRRRRYRLPHRSWTILDPASPARDPKPPRALVCPADQQHAHPPRARRAQAVAADLLQACSSICLAHGPSTWTTRWRS